MYYFLAFSATHVCVLCCSIQDWFYCLSCCCWQQYSNLKKAIVHAIRSFAACHGAADSMLHMARLTCKMIGFAAQKASTQATQHYYRAVELGEQEAAEALMLHGADPFKTCHRGDNETTPLHKAIDFGNLRFVRRFTESFAQSSKAQRASLQADCNGVTPLLR